MRKIVFIILLFLFLAVPKVYATAFTSSADGNWNASATWGKTGDPAVEGTDYPGNGDTATIANTHDVIVNVAVPSAGTVTTVTVATGGTLLINNNLTCATLSFAGIVNWLSTVSGSYTVTCSTLLQYNGGTFNIGTQANPISAYTATLSVASVTNSDASIHGILNFYGATKTYWYTTLSGAITAGEKSFTTTDTTAWAIGDVILVPATGTTQNETEAVTITGISTTTIYIDSNGNGTGANPVFANNHANGAYIFNSTRKVRIQSTGTEFALGKYDWHRGAITFNWVSFDDVRFDTQDCDSIAMNYIVIKNIAGSPNWNLGQVSTVTSFSNNIYYNSGLNGTNYGENSLQTDGTEVTENFNRDYITVMFSNNAFIKSSGVLSQRIKNVIFNTCWFYDIAAGVFACTDSGYVSDFSYWVEFRNCTFTTCESIIKNNLSSFTRGRMYFYGGTISNSVTSDWALVDWSNYHVYIYGTTFDDTPTFTTTTVDTEFICQDFKGTAGRYFARLVYGIISDQVTGGQNAAWANGGSGQCIYLDPSSTTAGQTLNLEFKIPVTAATNPALKLYVRTTVAAPDPNPTLNINVYDSDDDLTLLVSNASISLTEDWAQYSLASISPTTTGFCRVVLKALNGANTGDIGIDDISFSSGGSTYTDSCDRSADGLPMIFGVGAAAAGGGGARGARFLIQ